MISSKNIHELSQVFDPVKFTPRAEQRTRWHPDRSALFVATVRPWRGSYRWALSLLAPAVLLLALAHPAASRAQGGTWSPVKNLAPGSIWYSMILLPDGTIMGERIATPAVNIWNRLTPDRTGSYANGTWTTLPPMNETRNTNGHQVLRDGRLLVVGGEYGTGANNAEVYDPSTNTWTLVINKSGGTQRYLDANTAVLPDGKVLIGPAVPAVRGLTFIYDPATNTINPGPTTGVRDFLRDPQLQLFRQGEVAALVGSNDDWGGDRALSDAFASVGLYPLQPDSKDAAMLFNLEPGVYTLSLFGVNGATGTGMIELYAVP